MKPALPWTGGDTARTLVLGSLAGSTFGYTVLPWAAKELSGSAAMHASSLPLIVGFGAATAAGVALWGMYRDVRRFSRWAIFGLILLCLAQAAIRNPVPAFLGAAAVLLGVALVYALYGRCAAPARPLPGGSHPRLFGMAAALAGLAFFLFVGLWGVARVRSLAAPSFDFGIFAQMFQKMKQTGLPLTTLERDGLLSHFSVHLSPIYYLLLPAYLLWPRPELLPVLQALILAGAAIPLWGIGRQLGFSPALRFLLCLILFLHPACAGGTAYDLHENVFLTPLLFWLFWAAGRRSASLTAVFALLTAAVKEDAAVYVGIFGLYLTLLGLIDRRRRWEFRTGLGLLAGALVWFCGAVAILSRYGEGVMRYRYGNLMWPGSNSLLSVVLTVICAPVKVLFTCVSGDKPLYLLYTMGPLLGLPLLTRRYERLTLLIPLVLMNLMPDYSYQHNIYFQYSFGSLAFLLYASALNLRDLVPLSRRAPLRVLPALLSAAVCAAAFWSLDWKMGRYYIETWQTWREESAAVRDKLEALPPEAQVTASTYYTAALYDKREVYDVTYTSLEHLLSSDYVVLEPRYPNLYSGWTEEGEAPGAGLSNLTNCLLSNGFILCDQLGDRLLIYQRIG